MDFIFDDLIDSIGRTDYKKTALSEKEERAYFTIFRTATDKNIRLRAANKIIQNHILFVVSIAKQFASKRADVNDLIEQGILGMHRALLSFDHTKGIRFISYAVWWIRQTILDFCYNQANIVKLPEIYQRKLAKAKKDADRAGIDISDLPLDEKELQQLVNTENLLNLASMDKPIDDFPLLDGAEVRSLHTSVPGGDLNQEMLQKAQNDRLKSALDILNPKAKEIIKHYYGIDEKEKNLYEIGELLGNSHENIRLMKKRALAKLKKNMKRAHYDLD